MAVSTFDLYKIGIGPSSSHTVGPMRAACTFVQRLRDEGHLASTARVHAELFGSLGHTGRGHGTDKAVLLGLEGDLPDQVDPDTIGARIEAIFRDQKVMLDGEVEVEFLPKRDLTFHKRQTLPFHSNGMRFAALASDGRELLSRDYYSVGGGFVVNQEDAAANRIVKDTTAVTYPFSSGDELLAICETHERSIAQVMLANEQAWRSKAAIKKGLLAIWQAMQDCVSRGIRSEGVLPGGLRVVRRAPEMHRLLSERPEAALKDPLNIIDWVNLYALAVNEENAAGGARGDGTHQRRRGHRAGRSPLLRSFLCRRDRSWRHRFSAHGLSHRHSVQRKCFYLGRRSRLSG